MPRLTYRTTMPRPDDPDILDQITILLLEGLPLRYAGTLCGLAESTVYHWVSEGDREIQANPQAGELGSTALFAQVVKQARAEWVRGRVGVVMAGGKDWTAAMTHLERLDPQNFGRRTQVQVDSQVTVRTELPAGYVEAVPYLDGSAEPGLLPAGPLYIEAPPGTEPHTDPPSGDDQG